MGCFFVGMSPAYPLNGKQLSWLKYICRIVLELQSPDNSTRQGTAANRRRQAHLFIKFCIMNHVDLLNPTIPDLIMYVQFLKNSFMSPGTAKNYLSGSRIWVTHHRGNSLSYEVMRSKKFSQLLSLYQSMCCSKPACSLQKI